MILSLPLTASLRRTLTLPSLALAFLTVVLTFAGSAAAQMGAIVAVDEGAAELEGAMGGVTGKAGASVSKTGSGDGGAKKQTGKRTATRKKATTRKATNSSTGSKSNEPKTDSNDKADKPYDGFVIGDKYTFLNYEFAEAVKPVHTNAAKKEGASGLVQVEVLIDEDGTVLTARARTGNKLLHPEAERAALASVFNRPVVYGKPARAFGFVVYRFGPPED